HLQPGLLCRSEFVVLCFEGLDIDRRRLMFDGLAVFAITMLEFGGSFGKRLCQHSLFRQRRVALCPQRRDDSIWVFCCLIWWRDHLPPGAGVAHAGMRTTGYQPTTTDS